jgi:hypothetical protein
MKIKYKLAYIIVISLLPFISFGQGISINFPYSNVSACQDSSYTITWTGGGNELIDITVIDIQSFTVDFYIASNIVNTGSYTSSFAQGSFSLGLKQIYIQTSSLSTWTYGPTFNLTQCCLNDLLVTTQNNTAQTSGSVSFTATSSDPNPSFIWQSDFGQGFQTLNNFGNYSGVNTNTLTINNLQLANHLQQIRAISTSGDCIDTSNIATVTLTDTCINYMTVTDTLIINTTLSVIFTPNNVNTIKVYPNPASSHITIDYGDYTIMNGYTLQIINTLGQTMYTSPINTQTSYIDLTTWTGNGLYFVQIIDPQNNIIENRKIVIQ